MEGILGDKYEHEFEEDENPGRVPEYPLEQDHGIHKHSVHVMDEEEEAHWREMEKSFFDEADLNKDGELDLREYTKALFKDTHVRTTKPGTGNETGSSVGSLEEVEKERMEKMVFSCFVFTVQSDWSLQKKQFHEDDRDGNTKISFDEWIYAMYHNVPQEPEYEDGHDFHSFVGNLTEAEMSEAKEEARKDFDLMDSDKDGKVTYEEVSC
eukprot:372507-Hanusia_phi.AAC.1